MYRGVQKGAWRGVQSDAQSGGQRGVSSSTQRGGDVQRHGEVHRGEH